MRLQVFLSHSGACSRRKAIDFIKTGKVKVNGQIILEPSFNIDIQKDIVKFYGKEITLKEKIYIMLNKPIGVTTTKKDRFAKKTVFDLLPKEFSHLHSVGRLDKDTSGLLLLTNDGIITHKLTHPRFQITKKYQVHCNKKLSIQDENKLEKGVLLEDGLTAPCIIEQCGNDIYIEIYEGRKRQIRRMFASLGYDVIKLKRMEESEIRLGNLKTGTWRILTGKEIQTLKDKILNNKNK